MVTVRHVKIQNKTQNKVFGDDK
jgi:hypothetical protein